MQEVLQLFFEHNFLCLFSEWLSVGWHRCFWNLKKRKNYMNHDFHFLTFTSADTDTWLFLVTRVQRSQILLPTDMNNQKSLEGALWPYPLSVADDLSAAAQEASAALVPVKGMRLVPGAKLKKWQCCTRTINSMIFQLDYCRQRTIQLQLVLCAKTIFANLNLPCIGTVQKAPYSHCWTSLQLWNSAKWPRPPSRQMWDPLSFLHPQKWASTCEPDGDPSPCGRPDVDPWSHVSRVSWGCQRCLDPDKRKSALVCFRNFGWMSSWKIICHKEFHPNWRAVVFSQNLGTKLYDCCDGWLVGVCVRSSYAYDLWPLWSPTALQFTPFLGRAQL